MTTTSIPALLEPIQERLDAATPGPWVWSRRRPFGPDVPPRFELVKPVVLGEFNGMPMHGHPLNIIKSDNEWQPNDHDADFIAHSPTDTARLLAAVKAVAELHFAEGDPDHSTADICFECRDEWPCSTVSAVEAALRDEA
ncbi:hypothetical protein [Paenarthrobacter ureafaciens]|uniref:hypothetical protein n=1 Tax=Paenarthrobacter ureafaciens TaxID=37931 RepID=UPI001FB2A6C0|nr:hypothetical protein [Paenarthrobacter ureafaciens]UOD80331.1 hypothetical protein MQZ73_14580 [Paenarthrobacter ureafaciens]WNZ02984.1 hypothetical protein PVT25_15220 [Paenarthrobacter ureafaciens]